MRRALGWSADDVLAKINDAAHDDDEGNVEFVTRQTGEKEVVKPEEAIKRVIEAVKAL